jgi:hypothetical protein
MFSGGDQTFLALDAVNVYFMIDSRDGVQIAKVNKAGGDPVILASKMAYPRGLASNGSDLYWASYADGALRKTSVDGGAVSVFGNSSGSTAMDVVMDETSVYCACDFELLKFMRTGGQPVKLAAAKLGFMKLETDLSKLYAISHDYTRLYRISKSGGELAIFATFPQFSVGNFAVDATNVYWTNSRAGTVMSLRK